MVCIRVYIENVISLWTHQPNPRNHWSYFIWAPTEITGDFGRSRWLQQKTPGVGKSRSTNPGRDKLLLDHIGQQELPS